MELRHRYQDITTQAGLWADKNIPLVNAKNGAAIFPLAVAGFVMYLGLTASKTVQRLAQQGGEKLKSYTNKIPVLGAPLSGAIDITTSIAGVAFAAAAAVFAFLAFQRENISEEAHERRVLRSDMAQQLEERMQGLTVKKSTIDPNSKSDKELTLSQAVEVVMDKADDTFKNSRIDEAAAISVVLRKIAKERGIDNRIIPVDLTNKELKELIAGDTVSWRQADRPWEKGFWNKASLSLDDIVIPTTNTDTKPTALSAG